MRLLLVALLVASVACGPAPDPGPTPSMGGGYLVDPFPPEETPSVTPGPDGSGPVATPLSTGPDTTPAPVGASGAEPITASVSDPRGDVTRSVDRPPDYADLLGGTVTVSEDRTEVRVRLGAVPPEVERSDRTMNVAVVFDLDGDGELDVEAWANLADTGWYPAWFDNRSGRGWFGDESGVDVAAEGDEVVIGFASAKLEGVMRFRWALGSEWGRYEVISTPAAARDRAPDSGAVPFP